MSEPLQFLIKSAFDSTGITAATNSVKSIDAQINRVSRGFSQMMGLMGAGGIGAGLLAFSKRAIDMYSVEERSIGLLNKALDNLGITNRSVSKDLVEFAEGLEKTTKAEKEDILAVETSLIQRGLYGEELKHAVVASLDLATKTGSLSSAGELVGKAFQGVSKGLNSVGIIIDANTPKTQIYTEAMRQLNAMYGGAAAEEMDNTAGKVELIGKRFDDLTKRAGELLIGPAGHVLGWFEDLATILESITQDSKSAKIDLMHESLGRLDKKLSDMYAKNSSGSWFKYTDAEIQFTIEKIKTLTAEINTLTGGNKSTGSSVPTRKPVNADDNAERLKAQKHATEEAIRNDKEYLKESEKAMAEESEILNFELTDRGRMYTRYFGKIEMDRRRDNALAGTSAKQLQANNKKMLVELERDYEAASHTFSGGFKQAMDETSQNLFNWKNNWNQVINESIGPAKEAIHNFFTFTSDGFARIDKLAKGVFDGIKNAFFNMLEQMAAKAAIFGFLSILAPGSNVVAKGLGSFLGFSEGGPIPGAEGAPMPILAHGGEFVLSANVVKAIKSGSQTSGIPGGMLAAGGAGANINYSPTINIQGGVNGGNVREICRQIADAGRKGVTEALDAAKVLYKQGAKRSGENAL